MRAEAGENKTTSRRFSADRKPAVWANRRNSQRESKNAGFGKERFSSEKRIREEDALLKERADERIPVSLLKGLADGRAFENRIKPLAKARGLIWKK